MAEPDEPITIHTKRFYRVVLEAIDAEAETPDSFAIKLSSRVQVPLSRAKLVARCLPYIAKSGMSAEQANRLKTILEEIGGKARVEQHFVTPRDPRERTAPLRGEPRATKSPVLCPACGAEQPSEATFCSFCLRKFRDPSQRPATLEELLPGENPLDTERAASGLDWAAAVRIVRDRPVAFVLAVAVLVVVVVLLK